VIGCSRPTARRDRALAEGLPMLPRLRRVRYRETVLEEMDLPAILSRAPELCLIDELAHTNAPGTSTQALRRRRGRAGGRHRRALDAQRPAPRVAQRPHHRAERHPRARDDPRRDPRARRRGRADRPHARGAARAPARRQGLPAERIDAALNNFFKIENLAALREVALRQVAEEVGAKRLTTELVGSREESLAAERRRRSASACSRWSSPTPAPSAWCAARGARRSAWARSSTCCGFARRAGRSPRMSSARSRRCASSPRCSARGCSRRSPTTSRRVVESPRGAGTTYILIGARARRAGLRLRTPLPQRLMQRLPGRRRAHRRRPRQRPRLARRGP
jgi:two-component system sensor histidine kinase KdpD